MENETHFRWEIQKFKVSFVRELQLQSVLFANFSDNAQVGRYLATSTVPPAAPAFSGDPVVSNRPGFRGSKVGAMMQLDGKS